MIAREDNSATERERRRVPQISRGTGAYLLREVAELALLVAVLAIVSAVIEVPVGVLVGLPLAKALASLVFYVLFLRRSLQRPARVGAAHLVGKAAKAVTPLRPTGQVKVSGEIWSARSFDGTSVARHSDVEIVGTRGNTVLVAEPRHED